MNFIKAIKVEKAYRRKVKEAITASNTKEPEVKESGLTVRSAEIPVRTPEEEEALKSLKKTAIIGGSLLGFGVGTGIGVHQYNKHHQTDGELINLPEEGTPLDLEEIQNLDSISVGDTTFVREDTKDD